MAMNKKEKGQMEALRLERDMYRAMYVSAPVEPDVHKPEDFNAVNHGWIYNLYLRKAEKAAVNSVYHTRGERAWDSHDKTQWMVTRSAVDLFHEDPCFTGNEIRVIRGLCQETCVV